MIGRTIAHYQLTDKLGAGGMGEVYRARDPKLNREVAIKVLPEGFAQDAERVARFLREAQVLASLNHPNIAAIYGLEEADGIRALVMELVEGPTLADRIAAGPIPLDEALAIARQIAEALEVAHERGIIHRDLKPANVKVTRDDKVKVLDFGLAKIASGETTNSDLSHSPTMIQSTQAGMILGTAAYMSPEQARGKIVDKRADIWAFGGVLFEMLSGKQTFSGETLTDTLAAVVRAEPEWNELPPTTPLAVRRLLRRCLNKDPKQRLRDIGEARITLEQGKEMEEAAAEGTARYRRNLGLWIGAIAVIAVALTTLVMLQWAPARRELPLRQVRIDIHNFRVNLNSRPRISPDGRYLAYVVDEKLWVQPLEETKPHEVDKGFPESTGTLFWSADSSSLAYSKNGKLYRVPAAGGAPIEICKLPDTILDGAWSSDNRIVFSRWRSDLYQVSAQGGEPKPLGLVDPETEVDFHQVMFLPGEQALTVAVHPKNGPIRTDIVVGGQRKPLLEHGWVSAFSETGHLIVNERDSSWAVPFSLSDLKVKGETFKVLDGYLFSLGADGTVLYSPAGLPTQNQIVWVSRTGEIQQKIGEPMTPINSMALSPDGNRLAVCAGATDGFKMWVLDLVRNARTLMTGGEKSEPSSVWSPDGKHIFYETRLQGLSATLSVRSVDGTGEGRELGPGRLASVSRIGDVVAYDIPVQDGRNEMWYMRIDPRTAAPEPGSQPARYLTLSDPAVLIRLSPDGKFAAYRSAVSGRSEIYLSRFPTGEGRWQVSVDGGEEMMWNPQGGELFYVDGKTNLFSVGVATQPEVRLGKPQLLFSTREKHLQDYGFAVDSDGKRFVMVQSADDAANAGGLYLLQDWPALLRQTLKK